MKSSKAVESTPEPSKRNDVIDAASPIHAQMLESHKMRKKAEGDVQTLQNRIKLL